MSLNYEFSSPAEITIQVDGVILAHATAYEVKSSRACVAAESFGSALPIAFLPGSARYSIRLTRLLWEKNAVDYYTKSNFAVNITRFGQKISFSGCQWTAIEESNRDVRLWESATLCALSRTEASV